MQNRKITVGLLAIGIVSTMALAVSASDTRISIDGGNGSWHGGIKDETAIVYSKIWDHFSDNRAYSATVWVKDALGDGNEVTGQTYGINENGEVKATCKAKYSAFGKNRSGYKDLTIVDLNTRQAYLRDTTAPSFFEVELEFANPADNN